MIRGLLLAGGASARFGSAKLLHPYEDGLTLGQVAARHLIEALGSALAIVRPGDDELAERLRAVGCEVLVAPRSLHGLGESIAAGVAAASAADGWLVALADMPRIQPRTHRAIASALSESGGIVAPVLQSTLARGHPVGFADTYREELLALRGDEGARAILQRHGSQVRLIPMADAGIVLDVDRPADLDV